MRRQIMGIFSGSSILILQNLLEIYLFEIVNLKKKRVKNIEWNKNCCTCLTDLFSIVSMHLTLELFSV